MFMCVSACVFVCVLSTYSTLVTDYLAEMNYVQ